MLTIDDPASGQAVVTMTVSNANTDTFDVEEHAYHGSVINVVDLSAYDSAGNQFLVDYMPDSGTRWGDGNADVWRIHSAGLSQFAVQHVVEPGILDAGKWHQGYIGPEFAALSGEFVFLVPRGCAVDQARVSFEVPDGWEIATPWIQQDDRYDPFAIRESAVVRNLVLSSFALGRFEQHSRTFGTTQVDLAIYAGWPASVKEELAQGSWDVFDFVRSVFGEAVGDRYLWIHYPEAPDGLPGWSGEWASSAGFTVKVEEDGSSTHRWNNFAHGVFHRWISSWPWGLIDEWWLHEGAATFYEYRTLAKLGWHGLQDFPGEVELTRGLPWRGRSEDPSPVQVETGPTGRSITIAVPTSLLGYPTLVSVNPWTFTLSGMGFDWFEPRPPWIPRGSESLQLMASDTVGDTVGLRVAGADLVAIYGLMDDSWTRVRLDFAGEIRPRFRYWLPYEAHLRDVQPFRVEYVQVSYVPPGRTDRIRERLEETYDVYLSKYAGTDKDESLIIATDVFLVYGKSSMVMLLVADRIYQATNGTMTMDDLQRTLFERYGYHSQPCPASEVLRTVNDLTGTDFSDLFEEYVYAAGTLDLDWIFEDADADHLWDGMEILLDTDRTNPDTDGDGVVDGVEVEMGTDPTVYDEFHFVYLPMVRVD